jgi:hypothetical protein
MPPPSSASLCWAINADVSEAPTRIETRRFAQYQLGKPAVLACKRRTLPFGSHEVRQADQTPAVKLGNNSTVKSAPGAARFAVTNYLSWPLVECALEEASLTPLACNTAKGLRGTLFYSRGPYAKSRSKWSES